MRVPDRLSLIGDNSNGYNERSNSNGYDERSRSKKDNASDYQRMMTVPDRIMVCVFWEMAKHSVICYCKLNNTHDCEEHLFIQASTCTGRYQLLIFRWKIVHPWRWACLHATIDDVMSYNLLTTIHWLSFILRSLWTQFLMYTQPSRYNLFLPYNILHWMSCTVGSK